MGENSTGITELTIDHDASRVEKQSVTVKLRPPLVENISGILNLAVGRVSSNSVTTDGEHGNIDHSLEDRRNKKNLEQTLSKFSIPPDPKDPNALLEVKLNKDDMKIIQVEIEKRYGSDIASNLLYGETWNEISENFGSAEAMARIRGMAGDLKGRFANSGIFKKNK